MKTARKFWAMLLVLMMVLSVIPMSALAVDKPLTTTDTVDGLTVSVDYNTEMVYLQKVSSTEYNVLCGSTNGYYPFSFSMIMSNRSLVDGRPAVSNNGTFAWAYTLQVTSGDMVQVIAQSGTESPVLTVLKCS